MPLARSPIWGAKSKADSGPRMASRTLRIYDKVSKLAVARSLGLESPANLLSETGVRIGNQSAVQCHVSLSGSINPNQYLTKRPDTLHAAARPLVRPRSEQAVFW